MTLRVPPAFAMQSLAGRYDPASGISIKLRLISTTKCFCFSSQSMVTFELWLRVGKHGELLVQPALVRHLGIGDVTSHRL